MRIDGLPNLSKAAQGTPRTVVGKKSLVSDDVVELSQSAKVADLAAASRKEQVNPQIDEVRARVASGCYDSESAR